MNAPGSNKAIQICVLWHIASSCQKQEDDLMFCKGKENSVWRATKTVSITERQHCFLFHWFMSSMTELFILDYTFVIDVYDINYVWVFR